MQNKFDLNQKTFNSLEKLAINESNNQSGGLPGRDVLKGAAAAGFGLSAFANLPTGDAIAATTSGSDVIRKENANPGTRDWMLTKTDITDNEPVELWRSPRIEGCRRGQAGFSVFRSSRLAYDD